MKQNKIVSQIHLQESAVPKYMQLVNSFLQLIESGTIKKGEVLPSINQLSIGLSISRDTAEKAFKHLKEIKVINSVTGKGYFITDATSRQKLRVLMLFDSLGSQKKTIYEAFIRTLGTAATIDFHVFNKDFNELMRLLDHREKDYTHYVILPCFVGAAQDVSKLTQIIPAVKLVLLSNSIAGIKGNYAAVYENFEGDIYSALKKVMDRLLKYSTLKMVFPKHCKLPLDIVRGFNRFCLDYKFTGRVISSLEKEPPLEGDAFICVTDTDLVKLIQMMETQKLEAGKHVGIISYNETPLKKVLLNGITTISADFEKMGIMAAKMILNNKFERLQVPFNLTLRASL
jgi:DNA-binding transcriptional regulator YhcF (GntR family)